MNAVRKFGKTILVGALGAMLLTGVVPVAVGQSAISNNCMCGKNIGRGGGYPMTITVMMAGKPVAGAAVTINTIHGVPVKSLKTDGSGVATDKTLASGDYIVMAQTKTASGMVKATEGAKASSVTVLLTPNQQ